MFYPYILYSIFMHVYDKLKEQFISYVKGWTRRERKRSSREKMCGKAGKGKSIRCWFIAVKGV